jgi:hypothetical protein
MITSTNHAGASGRFARIAAYVGHLFEDVPKAEAIELHHFECPQPDSRGLNRPYELGELMSRVIVP